MHKKYLVSGEILDRILNKEKPKLLRYSEIFDLVAATGENQPIESPILDVSNLSPRQQQLFKKIDESGLFTWSDNNVWFRGKKFERSMLDYLSNFYTNEKMEGKDKFFGAVEEIDENLQINDYRELDIYNKLLKSGQFHFDKEGVWFDNKFVGPYHILIYINHYLKNSSKDKIQGLENFYNKLNDLKITKPGKRIEHVPW